MFSFSSPSRTAFIYYSDLISCSWNSKPVLPCAVLCLQIHKNSQLNLHESYKVKVRLKALVGHSAIFQMFSILIQFQWTALDGSAWYIRSSAIYSSGDLFGRQCQCYSQVLVFISSVIFCQIWRIYRDGKGTVWILSSGRWWRWLPYNCPCSCEPLAGCLTFYLEEMEISIQQENV